MTKQQLLDHLIHCAKVVVNESRREFATGELEDVDELEQSIAAYEAAVEPRSTIEMTRYSWDYDGQMSADANGEYVRYDDVERLLHPEPDSRLGAGTSHRRRWLPD